MSTAAREHYSMKLDIGYCPVVLGRSFRSGKSGQFRLHYPLQLFPEVNANVNLHFEIYFSGSNLIDSTTRFNRPLLETFAR